MRKTPPIPEWLRGYRHPAYTNIYELYPDETRVFGTESLFGDWDAELLLVAKDYAPRYVIEGRRDGGDPRPFRHGERRKERCYALPGQKPNMMGCLTNERLGRLAKRLDGFPLLYGSALGGLMRNDREVSGNLPEERRILREYAAPLLQWCVTQMPMVRAVACLGTDAIDAVSICAGAPPSEPGYGGSFPITIEGRRLMAFKLHHPAARKKLAVFESEWQEMTEALGVSTG